ncbi:MAG: photosynthetic complex putative assembly protein PuhB [Gemmatimonadota bacterium]|jgi:hypothetical protein
MDKTYIRGVDEPLPENETLLWEGSPDARALARHAFKRRWVVAYFAVLAGLAAFTGAAGTGLARALWLVVLGGVVYGFVTLWAHLVARSSVYALTDKRLVMKIGVAFPSVFNLPLDLVGDAWIRAYGDGSGDVAFQLEGSDRIGMLFLWPHVRPWRFRDPQPMLRGLGEVETAGEIIRQAVRAARVGAEPKTERRGVVYSVMDDDGIEILSNRRPEREQQRA